MKKKLERITNFTINDLLNTEIILPSLYLEKFNYYAKEIEINLDDINFTDEINQILIDDFKTIEKYMNFVVSGISELKTNTEDVKNAIVNRDLNAVDDILKKIILLEREVEKLNDELFIDEITKTYNRKWIYTKFLNVDFTFKDNGICVLVDIMDYGYIQKEYGELLANNLLIFVTKFISQKLKDEKIDFKIAKFLDDKFFIFISNENEKQINNFILNLKQLLSNTTLKSHSGLYIKANYQFKLEEYKINQDSKEIFEKFLTIFTPSS